MENKKIKFVFIDFRFDIRKQFSSASVNQRNETEQRKLITFPFCDTYRYFCCVHYISTKITCFECGAQIALRIASNWIDDRWRSRVRAFGLLFVYLFFFCAFTKLNNGEQNTIY